MNINGLKKGIFSNRKLSDILFIFWAGGAALLSYSLVYALRKPFTAATFDGLDFFGMDYKTVTSIVQIFGYFLSKLIGIKVISELVCFPGRSMYLLSFLMDSHWVACGE